MRRVASWIALPAAVIALTGVGLAQAPGAGGGRGVGAWQSGLDADLQGMRSRLGGGRLGADQVVADSERLRSRYRSLPPLPAQFGPDDYRRQGPLAQQSFAWLDGAYRQYGASAPVARSLLDTYSVVGDFYGRGGLGSRTGFWLGYAGAHRAGRGLLMAGGADGAFERRLEALALTWAGVAAVNWHVNDWYWSDFIRRKEGDRLINQAVSAEPAPDPVPVPIVDASALSPAGQAKWREVRERFASVSARVHQAQVALADLRGRLAQQGLTLHANNVAASLAMQGYLQDAADAVEAREFDRASDALTRADYERNKVRAATGQ
jgi:hypothetical protein